ncbi:uncharacterized threonine-rich GPI-anchored glycoprotein PJ4664.02-like [Thalassophryne amazonica]|uniref:uncharacterized threonine-rich GPI-anchored glycoprotein PJ4664.02-like n=1 Tax=Thalassophryne amazonica TaxID=390379 RepID=UPI0014724AAF|nr:uncharacterized threonine-rich GPI-anchored glycoprotein PJ4664.02-like [Thalassophryne amazonica]
MAGMAILRIGSAIVALLVILCILKMEKLIDFTREVLQAHHDKELFGTHAREKRSVSHNVIEYEVDVELIATDVHTVEDFRRSLDSGNFLLTLNSSVNITNIEITTAPFLFEYLVSIELNISNGIDGLRTILINTSYPITINNQIQIHEINMSTVCSPSDAGFQCRCEDGYRWSCDQCLLYGSCDNITDDTCGCIGAFPTDGTYCQAADQNSKHFEVFIVPVSRPWWLLFYGLSGFNRSITIKFNIHSNTRFGHNASHNWSTHCSYEFNIHSHNRFGHNASHNWSIHCSYEFNIHSHNRFGHNASHNWSTRCSYKFNIYSHNRFGHNASHNCSTHYSYKFNIHSNTRFGHNASHNWSTHCSYEFNIHSNNRFGHNASHNWSTHCSYDFNIIHSHNRFGHNASHNWSTRCSYKFNIYSHNRFGHNASHNCSTHYSYKFNIHSNTRFGHNASHNWSTHCSYEFGHNASHNWSTRCSYKFNIYSHNRFGHNASHNCSTHYSYKFNIHSNTRFGHNASHNWSTHCSYEFGHNASHNWSTRCSYKFNIYSHNRFGHNASHNCSTHYSYKFNIHSNTRFGHNASHNWSTHCSYEFNIYSHNRFGHNASHNCSTHYSYKFNIHSNTRFGHNASHNCSTHYSYKFNIHSNTRFGHNASHNWSTHCSYEFGHNASHNWSTRCSYKFNIYSHNRFGHNASHNCSTHYSYKFNIHSNTRFGHNASHNWSTHCSYEFGHNASHNWSTRCSYKFNIYSHNRFGHNASHNCSTHYSYKFNIHSNTRFGHNASHNWSTHCSYEFGHNASHNWSTRCSYKFNIYSHNRFGHNASHNCSTHYSYKFNIYSNNRFGHNASHNWSTHYNSTSIPTTDLDTTPLTTGLPAVVTNSTSIPTTDLDTTPLTTVLPAIVTNSTSIPTTDLDATPLTTGLSTVVTNSTSIPTTDLDTTPLTTGLPAVVTNSTSIPTTDLDTTPLTTVLPTIVTNSTSIPTTDLDTTPSTTVLPPTITNSTSIATMVVGTTPPTTVQPTVVTSLTSIATTDLYSTSPSSGLPTVVTNSTSITTTDLNTTPLTTGLPTTVTNSTPIATTDVGTTPPATVQPTVATSPATVPPPDLTTPTVIVTRFQLEMSVTLHETYTAELGDPTSAEYKALTSKIEPVLNDVYSGLTGFIKLFVQKYSPGSIIASFAVETTTVNSGQIITANEKLEEEIKVVAPVNGSVSAFYNSSEPLSFPSITYTGSKLKVTCSQPDNLDVGQLSDSVWKINGNKLKDNSRVEIITSNRASTLNINNVILADSGRYECTLVGKALNFLQQGDLQKGVAIRQAPNVRVPSRVNVGCIEGPREPLVCCVQSNYRVKLFRDATVLDTKVVPDKSGDYCIQHNYTLNNCDTPLSFVCRVDDPKGYEITTTITIFKGGAVCKDTEYGIGQAGDISTIECDPDQEGSKTAVCESNGKWKLKEDTCILIEVNELLIESQNVAEKEVPELVEKLNAVVQNNTAEITNSSATILAVVNILNNIASVTTSANETVVQNILETVEIIIGDDARGSWDILNANETLNASSTLLASLERLSEVLVGEFTIQTQNILLNRTTFDNYFSANLNSTVTIDIPNTNTVDIFITTIVFATLRNALPPRNASFNVSSFSVTTNKTLNDTINAAVMLVSTNATIHNVTMRFTKVNNSLTQNAQCVFWNFRLLDDLGAWDHEGCTFVSDIDNIITCNCSHLTSFSVLMGTGIPESLRLILDIITYIGVGISLASLLICLIIEGYVWKTVTRNSTAFMRHVSIVNIALALLIADICFIIGTAIAKNPGENPGEDYHTPVGPCSTATFFMHFFYLALFFWMLVSALLLLYRTLLVFSHMSKKAMLAVGFSLGYGCPLIIAVVTVAVTAPGNMYIRRSEACWLNWHESMALLAFVVPALVIVLINFIILIVVLIKMLRRGAGDASQPGEKNALIVILRCVAFLAPLFGLTWGLGVGTMTSPTNKGIHIAFAFLNSLQGFFILLFGTIFDSKIRAVLARTLPTLSTRSNPTQSTSGGVSSSSTLNFIWRLPGRRNVYRLSQAANSSTAGTSESFINV